MSTKIQDHHLNRTAQIYLRQSTPAQVRQHVESTDRQFHFQERALELGWPAERIRILTRDLGVSGAQTYNREDFKSLVAEVSMGQVGAVFALEAQRLARSSADWHRMMELCALTKTLIIDADGCYDPSDFNDGLLLGLKATMSQAELHIMRERLQGAKLNKARRGELRVSLPIGFCYDEEGHTVQDPDEQVRKIVEILFATFREVGSAYGVVHRFIKEDILFPLRIYGGVRHGQLTWGPLRYKRVHRILHHPGYTGTYAYGRHESFKGLSPEGEIYPRRRDRPMEEWLVTIRDHHEGYISWEEFLANLETLEQNRIQPRESALNGPPREGSALLQGLLFCGICNRRLTVGYRNRRQKYPIYYCNARTPDGEPSCISIRGDLLDDAVSRRALEVVEPVQIELAFRALEELERREEGLTEQWRLRLERAEYEAQLAERRYEEVDPANRLVASTLETRWNEALERLEEVRQQVQRKRQQQTRFATAEQKARVLTLAQDLPKLWHAPSTGYRDKKRILRLLLKDITIQDLPSRRQVLLQLRWQGGATEEIPVDRPPKLLELNRHPQAVVDRIRELAQNLTDAQITTQINQEGLRAKNGQPFKISNVQDIRYRHGIPRAQLKKPEELTVQQVAERLAVQPSTVYYWIRTGSLPARKAQPGFPHWITLDSHTEMELRERIKGSPRLQRRGPTSSRTS